MQQTVMIKHGSSEKVKEESQMEMITKPDVEVAAISAAQFDIEIDLNHLKQEPGLVQSEQNEPALSVKKEIMEDSSQVEKEQQFVQGASTSSDTDSANEDASPGDLLNVKREFEDMDIGPTLLQHMDIHYRINKMPNKDRKFGVDIWSLDCDGDLPETLMDFLLADCSDCSEESVGSDAMEDGGCVNVDDLQNMSAVKEENTFLDDCNKAMPCIRVKESVEDQLRDNKTISNKYCNQMTTKEDYDETYLKSCLEQQKDLQQHGLCQHGTTSYSIFKCDACERTFRKLHLLSSHKKTHQRNKSKTSMMISSTVAKPSNQSQNGSEIQKPFVCHVCEKGYSSMVGLNFHKRSHSGVGLSVCHICDVKFSRKSNLTNHLRIHTGEKSCQCATCGARFVKSSNLTRHMRFHTGEKPYQCDMCDARFTRTIHLITHMRSHTGDKPYQCDTCNASFTNSTYLRVHMRVHTGEKPYHCNMCDASYAQNSSLTGHMRVHTGEKPYKCDRCDATFARSGYLNAHMKIHMGEKPYQCDMCDASFAQRCQLTRHVRVHTGEKPYKCDMCDARFTDGSAFTRHRRSRAHIERVAMHVQ